MLVRLAQDPREPPDARGDALRVLAARLGEKKVSLADCARQGRGARPDTSGLPAAVRLAEAKDARGRPALRRFLGSSDTGLAAVAALHLVFELGDREAADALARLAGRFNSRFKLAAGYALGLVGHPASERFSFRRVPGCRIEIVRDGLNKAFAMVDGYARANVWSLPQFYSASHGQAYSTHYVRWVHADALWRRRGLARAAMAGCLKSSRWDRLCSTSSLHTGVENVAHALYRSFGFNDIHAFTSFKKDLRTPLAAARPPRGVKLRRARSKDAAETAAFINRLHASLDQTAARLGDWPGDETAWLAWRDGKIVGVASAEAVAGRASLEVFEIAEFKEKEKKGKKDKPRREGRPPPPDRREQTAQALLAALHRTLKRAKTWEVEGATWRLPADKFHYWQLRRAGYGTHAAGGVELHRLNSLPQFLRETRPMFEKRLAASAKWRDWHGRVRLCAGHETATLRFQRGRVAVETDGRGQADMEVRGDRATFVRLLLACGSPFAAALQLDVRVRAGFNGSARELLDVLFPRLYAE
jgi:ribosomal protein S18 acetylase RimI-like enzyme